MITVRVIPAGELSAEDVASWTGLQEADPSLASPFFRPEFTQAVAAVRDDVRVGILEERGEPAGFFPFQGAGSVGLPVGAPMNDYQGMIARAGVVCDPRQLLAGCRLAAWRFDHLPASQAPFWAYGCVRAASPFMDLSRGFDVYAETVRARHCNVLAAVGQKSRKAAREIGPLRFVPHTADRRLFRTLQEWKTRQVCLQKSAFHVPQWAWNVREAMFGRSCDLFGETLSALYFGDQLAAIHLGLRCRDVLHAWVPVFNPAFQKYSPGMILWIETAKACEHLGIRRLDFGKGTERFKMQLMSGATHLAEGTVDSRPVAGSLWRGWLRTRDWVRRSRLRGLARRIGGAMNRPRAKAWRE